MPIDTPMEHHYKIFKSQFTPTSLQTSSVPYHRGIRINYLANFATSYNSCLQEVPLVLLDISKDVALLSRGSPLVLLPIRGGILV